MVLSEESRQRLLVRKETILKSLKKARKDLVWWQQELNLVNRELADYCQLILEGLGHE